MAQKDNDVRESWDDDDTAGGDTDASSSLASSFSKFNINATEFVPSFGGSKPTPAAPAPSRASEPVANVAKAPETQPVSAPKKASETVKKEKEPSVQAAAQSKVKRAEVIPPSQPKELATGDGDIEEEERKAPPPPRVNGSEGPKKEHLNIVFIGHVDAGKSTIGGHLMLLTGAVDKRTMEKYEREAKEASRESWYLSWALDTNPEERDKGKTVEVGRAAFETEKKHFTILDAPGHKSFVANMLEGAAQADVGILVISARKGEFETGFDRGGQTREHALLAKTSGVKHLIVVINKMDDPTVNWSVERYNECKDKILPYLKSVGYNPKTDVVFMPLSGFTGANMKEPLDKSVCSWYDGPSFLQYLDQLPRFERSGEGVLRIPIIGRFREMGTVVTGKIESGAIRRGDQLLLMPNKIPVEALQIWSDENEVDQAINGDNVRVKLKGVEEEEVQAGFILCDAASPCKTGKIFDGQVVILEHRNIICAGYSAIMHLNALQEHVSVSMIICLKDKKTGEIDKTAPRPKFIKPGQAGIVRFECQDGVICMDIDNPQLARFTLRDEGKTIGFGKIVKVVQ
ncbi:hypothetical protein RvY_13967 [Ramazzottius varieornatus]|uniref:Tr-type G domain-containing protein n=1 Tax=Ramazzottius varieornatus TaxID=947166 RepID=A0A1D1VUV5_RAMVA|nr:hypothetical protein RvY_13967 [Ramazzottius varieornatus]